MDAFEGEESSEESFEESSEDSDEEEEEEEEEEGKKGVCDSECVVIYIYMCLFLPFL